LSRILAEILPFDCPQFFQRITDLAEVITIADLCVESLHISEQLATITIDSRIAPNASNPKETSSAAFTLIDLLENSTKDY